MMIRLREAAVLMAFAVTFAGCGRAGRPKTVPVSGKVLVNGKAVEGVSLSFHTVGATPENSIPSIARSRADGTFAVSSFLPNDGMPPGEYVVTVAWPERYEKIGEQEFPVGDRLNGAYAMKEKTPLRVTIREGDTQLDPFDLKLR